MIGWRDLRAPLLIFGRGIDVLTTPRCVMDSSIVRVKKMRTRTNAYFIKRPRRTLIYWPRRYCDGSGVAKEASLVRLTHSSATWFLFMWFRTHVIRKLVNGISINSLQWKIYNGTLLGVWKRRKWTKKDTTYTTTTPDTISESRLSPQKSFLLKSCQTQIIYASRRCILDIGSREDILDCVVHIKDRPLFKRTLRICHNCHHII